MPVADGFIPPKTQARQPGYAGRKWYPAAVLIAQGASNKEACEILKISLSTLSRWRLHDKFKSAVNKIHDDCVEQAVGKLAGVMTKSADEIIKMLDSTDDKTKLGAIDRVERWMKIFRNDRIILEKLQALEQRMPGVTGSATYGG